MIPVIVYVFYVFVRRMCVVDDVTEEGEAGGTAVADSLPGTFLTRTPNRNSSPA